MAANVRVLSWSYVLPIYGFGRAVSKDIELENTYLTLLKETSPHEKSIIRDLGRWAALSRDNLYQHSKVRLLRTFPHHEFFTDGQGIGQENLFNVLKAYSLRVSVQTYPLFPTYTSFRYDPQVGYCQGLPFVVAVLLLNVRTPVP